MLRVAGDYLVPLPRGPFERLVDGLLVAGVDLLAVNSDVGGFFVVPALRIYGHGSFLSQYSSVCLSKDITERPVVASTRPGQAVRPTAS